MNIVFTSGVLAISIDLELDVERRGVDQQKSLEIVGGQLANLLGRYRMPATWAVADPAVSAAIDRIRAASSAHEIAILGDRTWIGPAADRPRFARELTRRATRGRTEGLAISTLVLRGTGLESHLDLAVKQGITAVARTDVPPVGKWFAQQRPEISALRFGLWQLPTQFSLPTERDWRIWQSPLRQVKAALVGAATQPELIHLSISGLAAAHRPVLATLERVLAEAARLRDEGRLAIETIAATSRRLSGAHKSVPARSILQPAA